MFKLHEPNTSRVRYLYSDSKVFTGFWKTYHFFNLYFRFSLVPYPKIKWINWGQEGSPNKKRLYTNG